MLLTDQKHCIFYFFTIQRMFLRIFSFYKIFIFVPFILHSFAKSDVLKNSSVLEADINDTIFDNLYNDPGQNSSIFNQSMSDFDFNISSSNISFDVATELESTISVTEDSDSSQKSDVNREMFLFLTPDEDICNCDLSINTCDINCCCDPDCSEEDIQIFSECIHQLPPPDENYCYQKDIILRNNTVYKMIKHPSNALFCIVHDNFKHHLRFRDIPVLKSHRDVITVLKYKYKNTYSWDTELDITYDSRELRAGNPIYISSTSNKEMIKKPWSLPSACLSDVCSCEQEVSFLVDFRSSCAHLIRDVEAECERSDLLSGDRFVSFCLAQFSAHTLSNLVAHTRAYSQAEDTVCATISAETRLRPSKGKARCEGVVRHVDFTVEQDGAGGIARILVDFRHDNLSFGQRALLQQSYSVRFAWKNETEAGRRSGNPGYQVGLPVLAAANGSEETPRVFLPDGLTVLAGDAAGVCDGSRRTVKFGHNLMTGCTLRRPDLSDCDSFREGVSEALLGPGGRQLLVGVFGNANTSRPEDWTEVFHGEEGPAGEVGCALSLGLKVHVLHAAVGTFANPQHKIVGVRFLRSRRVLVEPGAVALTTSVSFFDVTAPAAEQYAKVPALEAHLPSDFFYPFLYGRGARTCADDVLLLLVCALVYCLLRP